MSTNDHTDSARVVNPHFGFPLDAIYTRAEIVSALGIADKTMTKWIGEGLRTLAASETRHLFYGRHILEFLAERKTGG